MRTPLKTNSWIFLGAQKESMSLCLPPMNSASPSLVHGIVRTIQTDTSKLNFRINPHLPSTFLSVAATYTLIQICWQLIRTANSIKLLIFGEACWGKRSDLINLFFTLIYPIQCTRRYMTKKMQQHLCSS